MIRCITRSACFPFLLNGLLVFNRPTSADPLQRGVSLQYVHLTGNTYQFEMTITGNCGDIHMSRLDLATPEICIFNDTNYVATIHLDIVTPKVMEYLCTGGTDSSNCTDFTYPYPGLMRYRYTGLYTLPATSHLWRFVFNGNLVNVDATRGADVTNVTGVGSTNVALVDTLDNTWHNNTSMHFTQEPDILYCVGVPLTFNPAAVDQDGDSLVFLFTNALVGTAACSSASMPACVNYVAPFSGAAPLFASSFSTDISTGSINWNMNAVQLSVLVYNVREYRNDTFVGSSMREIEILGLINCAPTCTDTIAVPAFTEHLQSGNEISVYPNPASGLVSIQMDGIPVGALTTVAVTDLCGRVVSFQKQPMGNDGILIVNLESLETGGYILQITTGGKTRYLRLIKTN